MTSDPRYWFPAKRHGWGWGVPRRWHGWAVLLLYTLVIGTAAVAGRGAAWQIPVFVVATLGVLVVCLVKGEPATWRWGREK